MDEREPTCWIVMAGPSDKLLTGDREAFGPFDSEDNAMMWITANLPERVLFTFFPVFGSVY